ncbi:MAG: M56 family metallopeptidase [Bryobacteraceae bacterium]|nr:M56 family metallopeptidase [Bryobacteraceae bacterium]
MNALLAGVLNSMLPALAVVAAVDFGLRKWRGTNASTRHAVWWMALVPVLVLPFVVRQEPVAPAMPAKAVMAAKRAPQASPPAASARMEPARVERETVRPEGPLMGLWMAGTLMLLARLAYGYAWLRLTKRRSTIEPGHSHRLENLLLRYGVGRRVKLLESPRVRTPIAAGFRKPAVIVPQGFASQLTAGEMHHVLLHEVAHLSRRDDWWNLLSRLVRAALWFHPAVNWILRRVEQEREMACDEWAAEASGQQRQYAESLARVAEISVSARFPLLATGALGGKAGITRRIERLLRPGELTARVSFSKLAASAAAIGLLVALCSESPVMVASAVADAPEPAKMPKAGFLSGLASAGYTGLEVDEIIELKNNGVSASYIGELATAGFGKLSPKELIELHNSGVKPKFLQGMVEAGLGKATLRELVQMSSHGVRPPEVAEIHGLGYGPYGPEQLIEFWQRGVKASFFRQLKEGGITQIEPREIIDAVSHGVNGGDIREARKYHPSLNMQQIIRLKQAGVI